MRALLDEVPIGRSEVLRTTSRGSRLIERGPSTAWAKETGTSIPIGRSITPTLDPRQISTAEQRAMTMCRADIAFTATRSNKAMSQMYPSVANRGRPPAIVAAICPGCWIAASSMPPSSIVRACSRRAKVPVAAFAKLFLTLPLGSKTDLYVELVGLVRPGDGVSYDVVQLYR